MTLKQNYMPWSINIGKGFSQNPYLWPIHEYRIWGSVLGK